MINYRLITLLNINYKILSVIESFIMLRQTKFLSSRQIRDNLMTVNIIVYLFKIKKRNKYTIRLLFTVTQRSIH